MIKVKSKVTINKKAIKNINETAKITLEQTAEALKTEVISAQVIPFDSGTLQNESTFVDRRDSKNGKVSLVSSTPYARRAYFHPEFNFQKVNNKNAKGLWYEDWVSGKNKNFCKETFKKLYKRNKK